jgi:hypothetical protein
MGNGKQQAATRLNFIPLGKWLLIIGGSPPIVLQLVVIAVRRRFDILNKRSINLVCSHAFGLLTFWEDVSLPVANLASLVIIVYLLRVALEERTCFSKPYLIQLALEASAS